MAAIGLAGYVVLLALTLLSLAPRHATSVALINALVGLSGVAVAFTLYLKYLEFFVIKAVCRWCVASAVLIAIFFVLAVLERRRLHRQPA